MEQQFALSTLAAQVVTQLDLRHKIALQERTTISLCDSESLLKKSESRLQLILDSAAYALWDVDVWDALRSERPYRSSWSEERVCQHLEFLSGTHFDPEMVALFLRHIPSVVRDQQRLLKAS